MTQKIKEFIIKEKYSILAVCVAILATIAILSLTSCKNFEVYHSEGKYPAECDLFITCMKYYSVQSNDSAFLGVVYQDCRDAMKQQRKSN